MRKLEVDVAIIGGGPAGLAAALAAHDQGAAEVLIIERNHELGASCSSASTTDLACTALRRSSQGPNTPSASLMN